MSERFDWTSPGLNKHHFIALANLLALRNGGQAEPISLYEEAKNGDDSNYNDETSSISTSRACQISVSGHDKLKREFLDCLAELIANEKGAKSVTCSSMREAEEEVTLWIARNEGFRASDYTFMEKLGRLLEGLPNKNGGEQTAEKLWKEMLAYYRDRLEVSYIPNLQSSFKYCDDILQRNGTDHFSTARESLRTLHQAAFNGYRPSQTLTDKHNTLVLKAYDLRMSRLVRELLWTGPYATNRTKMLWENVYFVGRLRVAFWRFIEISLKLPSFDKVSIVPVPHVTAPDNALRNPINLGQAFGVLGLPLDSSTIKAVIGPGWTVTKAKKRFKRLQNQKANVHAEIQMILYFSKNGRSLDQNFSYFGCSKYSCFMCWHFLRGLNGIATRGCHGRVFKPWSVPEALDLAPGRGDVLSMALIRLQESIRKELSLELIKTTAQVKTSVVGGSSVFSDPCSNHSEQHTYISRTQAQDVRVRADGFEDFPPPSCRRYLSVWSLKQLIAIDDPTNYPPPLAVQEDYGFLNCQGLEETRILMEVYKRLLLKANPLDLHKACLAGKLFEFAQRFHEMDEVHRRLMRNIYTSSGSNALKRVAQLAVAMFSGMAFYILWEKTISS